jgi:hypothetical protein
VHIVTRRALIRHSNRGVPVLPAVYAVADRDQCDLGASILVMTTVEDFLPGRTQS